MFLLRSHRALVAIVAAVIIASWSTDVMALKLGSAFSPHLFLTQIVLESPPAKDDKSAPDKPKVLEYELLRTPEKAYQRTTMWLYVRPLRPDIVVTARFFLIKDGTDFGRFQLRRLDTDPDRGSTEKDDGRMLFATECLAEEFTKESRISLSVHDAKTNKPVTAVSVPLNGAVVRKGS
ncbi:MAG: hypothetical protein U1A77_21370 [Pirellulales bacterium]